MSLLQMYWRWRLRRQEARIVEIRAIVQALKTTGDSLPWYGYKEAYAKAIGRAARYRVLLGEERAGDLPKARVVTGN